MLEDAGGIRRVVLACGTVDLRKGIDGLATIIGDKYGQNPFEKGTLFLFCGKRSDRCKGLLWMGTGFLLLYKRFEDGKLSWPRTTQEAAELTEEQYHYLMMGLNPLDPRIKDVNPSEVYCFLQALFPQKCRLNSSKLHGEFPQYCISSAGTLSGAGEEPLQAYKVY